MVKCQLQVDESTYVEVLGVNVAMLGKVEVLLGHEHTLCNQTSVSDYGSFLDLSQTQTPNVRWDNIGRSHTTEEVLVDLLAVVLGDKPWSLLVSCEIEKYLARSRWSLTLSRVPSAIRGIAQTTRGKWFK